MKINDRLIEAKRKAGLTTADMAEWFDGVGQSTMRTWLNKVEPAEHRHAQIEQGLHLLEKAIKDGSFFPVPMSVTQFARKDYIREVKHGIITRVRESRPAGGRDKVLGGDKKNRG